MWADPAGEARTAAMVAEAGGEDAEFATFVEPAGEHTALPSTHGPVVLQTKPFSELAHFPVQPRLLHCTLTHAIYKRVRSNSAPCLQA